MHLAVPKHNVLVIIFVSFYRMNTYTKLLRIGTQQHSSYIYCQFQTVFSSQIIILYFMSQQKIYTKRKIAYKKQNLEHICILCIHKIMYGLRHISSFFSFVYHFIRCLLR